MSTVPNRYYNSPWIEAAGRNLASALAPEDPEKTLAAQRAKWEFERAQELAQVQDEELARVQEARAAGGRLLTDSYEKPVATGTGPKQMGFAQFMQAGQPEHPSVRDDSAYNKDVIAATGGLPLGDVMNLMGTNSPKYKQELGVKEAGYDAQGNLLDRRLEAQKYMNENSMRGAMARAQLGIASREDMQAAGFTHDDEKQARQFDHDLDMVNARADATARAKGLKPYHLSHTDYQDIRLQVRRLEHLYGIPFTDADRLEMEGRVAEEMASNPSVPLASEAAFKRTLGDIRATPQTQNVEVPGKWFGTNTEQRLKPTFGGAVVPEMLARPPGPQPAPGGRPPLGSFQR